MDAALRPLQQANTILAHGQDVESFVTLEESHQRSHMKSRPIRDVLFELARQAVVVRPATGKESLIGVIVVDWSYSTSLRYLPIPPGKET